MKPKVFCLGFHKTGTTSFFFAMKALGYDPVGSVGLGIPEQAFTRENLLQECLRHTRAHDAFEDMPWPLFWRELDAAFPGARFVLLTRPSEGWIDSVCNHFTGEPTPMFRLVYGREHERPQDSRAHWVRTYEAHNAAVRTHFAGRPEIFLEMDLTRGDGWARLCNFLGEPVPAMPFPRRNTRARRASASYRVKRWLMRLSGRALLPEKLG